MAKVLNQQLYSAILYGADNVAGAGIQLQSTSHGIKGPVQLIGATIDLIVAGQLGSLVHANTATRLYSLPDSSGALAVSGELTTVGATWYAGAPGVLAVLDGLANGAMVSNASGVPSWATGTAGQVLTWSATGPQFAVLPDHGTVAAGLSNQLPYYQVSGNTLAPLTTTASRALLSSALGVLGWSLIAEGYLSSLGSPLAAGLSGQILTSDGATGFAWTPANPSTVVAAAQFALPYYSAAGIGSTLSGSSFLTINEVGRTLNLTNFGRARFYEFVGNGTAYIELKAPSALGATTTFTLPGADGPAGAYLVTDGVGNWSFQAINNGKVNSALANQLTYYAINGNEVQGLTTTPARVLTSPLGVPTWGLVTAPLLSTTGAGPLTNGSLNQVLVSDGTGNFNWVTATTLTGQVSSGTANYLAYYPATGTSVQSSSFVEIDDPGRLLKLHDGAQLQLFEPTGAGSFYTGLKSSIALAASISWYLPGTDGTIGQVIGTDGSGNLSFITVGRGTVQPGTADTLAYYAGAGTSVQTFATTAARTLQATAGGVLAWQLIQTQYLSTTGNLALDNGTPGQVLQADGTGNFAWVDASSLVGQVSSGLPGHLAYYPTGGTTVSSSSFLNTNDTSKILDLLNGASLRFHPTVGVNWLALTSPAVVTGNTTWVLPAADATLAGQVLASDAAGNLSFVDQVNPGTAQAVAFYAGTSRLVEPAPALTINGSTLTGLGALFTFQGGDGGSPTALTVAAGAGTGVNGADLQLRSGASTLVPGRVLLGLGATNYLIAEQAVTPYLSIQSGVALRLFDATINYIGFKAPTTVTGSTVWTLPAADGSPGYCLATNGVGTLAWAQVAVGTITPAVTTNPMTYYGAGSTLAPSQLLNPVGLPGTANQALVVGLTGQVGYLDLVQAAVVNQVAHYTGVQTVGGSTLFTFDPGIKTLQLQDTSKVSFYEALVNGSQAISIGAPALVSGSYGLTLPATAPQTGQQLVSDGSGQLSFATPGSDPTLEQRGVVQVPPGSDHVTVVFRQPFAATPGFVNAQWAYTGVGDQLPEDLPTLGIDQLSREGVVIQISTTVAFTSPYTVYWTAYRDGVVSANLSGYLAGGDVGVYDASILSMNLDNDTLAIATAATMTVARAYGMASSTPTSARIVGGIEGVLSTDRVADFNLGTATYTASVTSLPVARDSAGSVGTKTTGYFAGGETNGSSINTIAKLLMATDTASTLAASLTTAANRRGSATSYTAGQLVSSNATGTLQVLDYTSETVSVPGTAIGTNLAMVGCNDIPGGTSYFATAAGALYGADQTTNVVTALVATLSGTARAGAFNSMRRGYFAANTVVDAYEFDTGTTYLALTTLPASYTSGSTATFQSTGLL